MNSKATTEDRLDAVADRLGELYQKIGRLESGSVSVVLDELVAITEEIEDISGRKKRSSS